jgi:proliferating cell nuclear antigen PCNA
MDITFKYSNNFKGLFEALTSFVDNVSIHYDKNTLKIQAMDNGHISMIFIELCEDQFTKYNVKKSGVITLTSNSLKSIIRSMRDNDIVSMKMNDNNNNVIDFLLNDGDRTNIYSVKLIDMEFELLNMMNEIEHDYMVVSKKLGINKILNDIKNIDGDETIFHIDNDKNFIIETQNDQVSLKITPAKEIAQITSFAEENKNISVKYATKYLLYIQKMLTISRDRIICKIDTNAPLVVEFNIKVDDSITDKVSTLKYFLAPKIDDQ